VTAILNSSHSDDIPQIEPKGQLNLAAGIRKIFGGKAENQAEVSSFSHKFSLSSAFRRKSVSLDEMVTGSAWSGR
jgi:hypothetical protein